MEYLCVFWFSVVIVSILAEAMTTQLVSIWFMIGGICALIISILEFPFSLQLGIFAIISILMLVLIRPFVKNILNFKIQKTNSDRLIGKVAVVTEDIDNLAEKGNITISGIVWSARSLSGEYIPQGEYVQIDFISGVKVIVHKIQ